MKLDKPLNLNFGQLESRGRSGLNDLPGLEPESQSGEKVASDKNGELRKAQEKVKQLEKKLDEKTKQLDAQDKKQKDLDERYHAAEQELEKVQFQLELLQELLDQDELVDQQKSSATSDENKEGEGSE